MSIPHRNPFSHIFEDAPKILRQAGQLCDHPQCSEEGVHRAPKNRQGDILWFCLQHVRDYNASWNYYHDIPDDHMEHHVRNSITWDRPSWSFHRGGVHSSSFLNSFGFEELYQDPAVYESHSKSKLSHEVTEALQIFDLGYPYTKDQLKERYRLLVKNHHPDTHKDDPSCIEKIKAINAAYKLLKSEL